MVGENSNRKRTGEVHGIFKVLDEHLPVWPYFLGVPIKVRSVSHSALVIHWSYTGMFSEYQFLGFDK